MPSCTARRFTCESGVWGGGGKDAGHAGQLVGQRLGDDDLARMGAFVRLQDPQPPVTRSGVERQELHVAEEFGIVHQGDPGCPKLGQPILDKRKQNAVDVQGEVVINHAHAGSEHTVQLLCLRDRLCSQPRKVFVVEAPDSAALHRESRIVGDSAGNRSFSLQAHRIKKVPVALVPLRVHEVNRRMRGIQIHQNELQYGSPVEPGSECLKRCEVGDSDNAVVRIGRSWQG